MMSVASFGISSLPTAFLLMRDITAFVISTFHDLLQFIGLSVSAGRMSSSPSEASLSSNSQKIPFRLISLSCSSIVSRLPPKPFLAACQSAECPCQDIQISLGGGGGSNGVLRSIGWAVIAVSLVFICTFLSFFFFFFCFFCLFVFGCSFFVG